VNWAINNAVMIIMIIAYCAESSKVTWAINNDVMIIMIITIIAYCAE